ncbi:splicesome-associated protein [Dothidotthia symphoricarpi CBS 119687]|uniref:Splicesome-associated protein n=1 Tax=Dothidotthia symphoricarpi CBS 119687 TaxID=1392245 RepID=A0A6A6A0P2_9PLEO|nr:splicesome-associated protein [Dothidotthia symphoricarpi CBS 119687]KAF2125572.1 splicesome-associated protein [Dothidotthia symphoricarpi CBS 119687]
MLLDEQRQIHEDIERLEDAVAERLLEDPPHIRDRLARDHDISRFLTQIEIQSSRLLAIYEDAESKREEEVRDLTHGDPMESFMKEIASMKDFHRRYPNEPVENLEKAYKKRSPEDQVQSVAAIDSMFTGEEGFGRFFDLTTLHEQYLNLPVHQHARRLTYLQYLDLFDAFTPPQCNIRRDQKKSEAYFQYLKALQDYLEGFIRRTKPLENLDKLFANFDKEFEELWKAEEVPGWEKNDPAAVPTNGDAPGEGIWCTACKKSFSKETVYESHLTGKKHKKAVQEEANGSTNNSVAQANGASTDMQRFKERAVAEREFRIRKLAAAMQTERGDTKVNVERKQGMTERERQQELEQLYSEAPETGAKEEDEDSDGEDKIYNPLKLPLAWDGKPIPYWLYKLHGLGVEFPCEICGNFVYMGRRAFDKHFNEPRHIHGLKCLGITNTSLFREITSIKEAEDLWRKIQKDKKKEKAAAENVVEMEDTEGNVMPEKVYRDLAAAGML